MKQSIDLTPIMRELRLIEAARIANDPRIALVRDAENPEHYMLMATASAETGAVTSLTACWECKGGSALGRRSFPVPVLADPQVMHRNAWRAWDTLRQVVSACSMVRVAVDG